MLDLKEKVRGFRRIASQDGAVAALLLWWDSGADSGLWVSHRMEVLSAARLALNVDDQ